MSITLLLGFGLRTKMVLPTISWKRFFSSSFFLFLWFHSLHFPRSIELIISRFDRCLNQCFRLFWFGFVIVIQSTRFWSRIFRLSYNLSRGFEFLVYILYFLTIWIHGELAQWRDVKFTTVLEWALAES